MHRRLFVSNQKLPHIDSFGQSLLEIVVLIGLALVIITGLTVVTINGLKNTQFSQNKTQASRLAQDGIDKIRTARDQNCPVDMGGGTILYWYNNPSSIWSATLTTANSFQFVDGVSCGPATGTGLKALLPAGSPDMSLPTALQATFTRIITIENVSASQKKVVVTVNWTDISGSHQSNLTTILGEQ